MKLTKVFGLGHAFLTITLGSFTERQFLSEGACPLSVRCSWLPSYNQGKTLRCSDLEGNAGCGREKISGLRRKSGGESQRKESDQIKWPKRKKKVQGAVGRTAGIIPSRNVASLWVKAWSCSSHRNKPFLCCYSGKCPTKGTLASTIVNILNILCSAWFCESRMQSRVDPEREKKNHTGCR